MLCHSRRFSQWDREYAVFSPSNEITTPSSLATISSSCSRGSNGACYVKKYINSYCEREHWKVQEAEAKQMLHEYLTIPEDHMLHPTRHSKSITKTIVFGIRTKAAHDEYVKCRHLAYPLVCSAALCTMSAGQLANPGGCSGGSNTVTIPDCTK